MAASFIFFIKVDGPEKVSNVNVGLSDKQKEDIKKQITAAYQEQMDEMTDKVKENTESALEKLSNQKIQELSEYSETVLADINKNHNEVMFLYDMLNEKSKEVHNNIRDINIAVDRFNEAEKKAEKKAEAEKDTEKEEQKPVVKKQSKPRTSAKNTTARNKTVTEAQEEALEETAVAQESEPKKPTAKKTATGRRKTSKPAETSEEGASPSVNTEFMMGANKKEAVLTLHNEGKSNVEIAKILGLGVGEVKLVIDLFKGQK